MFYEDFGLTGAYSATPQIMKGQKGEVILNGNDREQMDAELAALLKSATVRGGIVGLVCYGRKVRYMRCGKDSPEVQEVVLADGETYAEYVRAIISASGSRWYCIFVEGTFEQGICRLVWENIRENAQASYWPCYYLEGLVTVVDDGIGSLPENGNGREYFPFTRDLYIEAKDDGTQTVFSLCRYKDRIMVRMDAIEKSGKGLSKDFASYEFALRNTAAYRDVFAKLLGPEEYYDMDREKRVLINTWVLG